MNHPESADPAGVADPAGPVSIAALLAELEALIAAGGVEDAGVDAAILLSHVLGVPRGRLQVLAVLGETVAPAAAGRSRALAEERASRVPLQHLTGRAPFRGIELSVGPGVFVPRPETEGVAQFAIDALLNSPDPEPIAVDLCTGSGAIALSLAHEVPTARIYAVEKSPEAAAWAARNVAEWGDGRVRLIHGDVAELDPRRAAGEPRAAAGSGPAAGGKSAPGAGRATATAPALAEVAALAGRCHVLVSNPPYVPAAMVPRDPEVRDHDPELALYSGEDGLDLIRVISRAGLGLVRQGGALVLEHAEGQGAAIRELLTADGWRAAATHPDLTGRDRATTAIR
ncbi:N5-glutamine methyltransferase family protein [Leucobacter edaphi]|uniref:N5-glutamine methyltransferase family protein n=1 Tax=Leucobacter edaphi TaxID=2796472 RepID=UPI0034E3029E